MLLRASVDRRMWEDRLVVGVFMESRKKGKEERKTETDLRDRILKAKEGKAKDQRSARALLVHSITHSVGATTHIKRCLWL